MILILPLLIVGGPPLLWAALNYFTTQGTPPPALTNQSITLLVSHPDDETMFFAPTLQAILKPEFNNSVTVVSLSNGNAEGLGKVRTGELRNACKMLGVADADKQVKVLDHPELQDSMTVEWDPRVVHEVIDQNVKTDVVITFDDQGISDHSNHKSTYIGAVRWKGEKPAERSVWVLRTVPWYRKYTCLVDALYTSLSHEYMPDENPRIQHNTKIIINSQLGYEKAKQAMVKGHKSQIKWYRWFYLQFSRYMVVNDLFRI